MEKPWGDLMILLHLTPDDFTRQRRKCLGPLAYFAHEKFGALNGPKSTFEPGIIESQDTIERVFTVYRYRPKTNKTKNTTGRGGALVFLHYY